MNFESEHVIGRILLILQSCDSQGLTHFILQTENHRTCRTANRYHRNSPFLSRPSCIPYYSRSMINEVYKFALLSPPPPKLCQWQVSDYKNLKIYVYCFMIILTSEGKFENVLRTLHCLHIWKILGVTFFNWNKSYQQ